MLPIELRQLLEHMTWADALVWTEVVAVPAAAEDRRLTELLHHVHAVQCAYLQVFRGEPVAIPEIASFDSRVALVSWGRECHEGLRDFAWALDSDGLEREVRFPWAAQLASQFGEVGRTDVRQALLQLASHSAYHRGQINTRIRQLGGEPPLTDFVAWVWRRQPTAEWP